MKTILTIEQVRDAIYQDKDFPSERLVSLAEASSSFIKNKTGHDFAEDEIIEPLAIQCAELYVKQLYFGSSSANYNRDYDYIVGITSLLIDLQNLLLEEVDEDV